jgi:glycosyltransferase involved in cell wall biosynthesis
MSAGAAERCAVLVPARDEAERIGAVVAAAAAADCGPVLVVDDGSRDGTARVAADAGAQVLELPRNLGKGGALAAGAAHLRCEVVVLLDADLTGLRPEHVRALAEPVLRGEAAMTRGVFRGARWATTTAQRLAPQLGGQRALRRVDLLALPGLSESRFGVEILLTDAARRHGWTWIDVPLDGVGQVMKEEKRGWWAGLRARAAMYRDIAQSWWRARR